MAELGFQGAKGEAGRWVWRGRPPARPPAKPIASDPGNAFAGLSVLFGHG